MPVYNYECKECGSKFEAVLSFYDQNNVKCPDCRGDVKRLWSAPTIIFRGPGFYSTDHKPNKVTTT